MGCGCGGSPAVWQPVAEGQEASAESEMSPNERIAHQQHLAAAQRVQPAVWTGRREPEKV